jgi:hypothetical protein
VLELADPGFAAHPLFRRTVPLCLKALSSQQARRRCQILRDLSM